MAFWYYPRVLFRARGVDFEVGLHPLNQHGRCGQQPCCSKANLWLKFTIQETFFSSSMAFEGSLRPKESWRWHQNRILSHLFQLYVKICWDRLHKKCLLSFYDVSKIDPRPKKIICRQTTPVYTIKRPTGFFVCWAPFYLVVVVFFSWWYRTGWFHLL